MAFCEDKCWHRTQAEADACTHHPSEKSFQTVNKAHPKCSTSKTRATPKKITSNEYEDTDDDLPIAAPVTPAPKTKAGSATKSPSPLIQKQGYPTPPFSQEIKEDIDDNIVVAMSSSSQTRSSSPAAAVLRQSPRSSPPVCGAQMPSGQHETSSVADDGDAEENEDLDDIPGPLSSSPPPPLAPRSPSAAAATTTTRVPETEIHPQTPNHNPNHREPTLTDLSNEILTLRADRARLSDALSTSTFQVRNLITRGKLHGIEVQLARREAAAAHAQANTASEVVDVAREGRKNAWTSVAIVGVVVLVYAVWCWWNSVEMLYVRRRRCWVYGLGEGC